MTEILLGFIDHHYGTLQIVAGGILAAGVLLLVAGLVRR